MEEIREVQKGFCILSVAYIVIGIVFLLWPDISVRTFCYLFGISMIIFGGAHLIMYFTRSQLSSVMQPDLVIGVVTAATGFYILLKMEYMLEIIPFAMGIVALLGCIVKIQDAVDLRRLKSGHWYMMLLFAAVLLALGVLLIMNPFDEQTKIVIILIAVSVLTDGIGNLIGIFWIGIVFKKLKRVDAGHLNKEYNGRFTEHVDVIDVQDGIDEEAQQMYPEVMNNSTTTEEE